MLQCIQVQRQLLMENIVFLKSHLVNWRSDNIIIIVLYWNNPILLRIFIFALYTCSMYTQLSEISICYDVNKLWYFIKSVDFYVRPKTLFSPVGFPK